jgi:ketosteroid isomerase-like protein
MAKKRAAVKSGRAKKKAARPKKGAAVKKAAAPSLDALARKIIRLTQVPAFGDAELRALYHEDATSQEAAGNVARGWAGLTEKNERWSQMQSGAKWTAKRFWVGRDTICIEWDATVNLRDGRTVSLPEIAVHEIKGGKIQSERFYYNPLLLAPPPKP